VSLAFDLPPDRITPRPPDSPQPTVARKMWLKLRNVLWHLSMIPVRSAATTGRGVQLAVFTIGYSIRDILTLRLPLAETMTQAWTLFKVTAIPAMLMAIPFGAMVSIQGSGLIAQMGATSLVGAGSAIAVIRQGAPIVAGMLMGGAAAAAIASDLGARAIREELDALRALGVNLTRHLVVPRFVALTVIAPILCVFIITTSVAASFTLAVSISDVTAGSFWMSFGTFARPVDVWFTVGKTVLFAAIVAIISSLRGMEAKGGPRGVADAVNSSVVLNVVCIAMANLAVTQLQTMFFPMAVS
jgi:phospholipid/cholesterol/gamma-HCH transport system permease protein